jgi:hypothetical protein
VRQYSGGAEAGNSPPSEWLSDFRNKLSVVIVNAGLALEMSDDGPCRERIAGALAAAWELDKIGNRAGHLRKAAPLMPVAPEQFPAEAASASH